MFYCVSTSLLPIPLNTRGCLSPSFRRQLPNAVSALTQTRWRYLPLFDRRYDEMHVLPTGSRFPFLLFFFLFKDDLNLIAIGRTSRQLSRWSCCKWSQEQPAELSRSLSYINARNENRSLAALQPRLVIMWVRREYISPCRKTPSIRHGVCLVRYSCPERRQIQAPAIPLSIACKHGVHPALYTTLLRSHLSRCSVTVEDRQDHQQLINSVG